MGERYKAKSTAFVVLSRSAGCRDHRRSEFHKQQQCLVEATVLVDPARFSVPDEVAFATKPAIAREMIVRVLDTGLPCAYYSESQAADNVGL